MSMDGVAAEPMKFAYWVPSFGAPGKPCKGYVASRIEMRTGWDLAYNIKLGQMAEEAGAEYALTPGPFSVSHLADGQHEMIPLSEYILAHTKKLKVICSMHTGLWHPGVVAKLLSTVDNLSDGRLGINVLSGSFKEEYTKVGALWLEHDERYRQSEEFIQALKGCWTQEKFTFKGDFFRINEYILSPPPVQQPHPVIFQGGSSTAARKMAARYSDVYFTNGGSLDVIKQQVDEVSGYAAAHGRRIKVGMNSFVIARDTEKEALETYREIVRLADWELVKAFGEQLKHFGDQVKEAGKLTREGYAAGHGRHMGNWAPSTSEDLIQYNEGFKPNFIGTPEQIAERMMAYEEIGVALILMAFLHFQEEIQYFGKRVLPLLRELEAEHAKTGKKVRRS